MQHSSAKLASKPFRVLSLLLAIVLILSVLPVSVQASPSTDYTLTGNQAADVIAVAKAQVGKTMSDFGWNVSWCGYFAGWAGRTAGADFPNQTYSANGRVMTYWFVHNNKGMFYYFRDGNYDSLISHHPNMNNKDHCIKSDRSTFVPQKGDIIMYLWDPPASPTDNWSHVGLVDSYSNGKVYTVEGNVDSKVKTLTRTFNDSQIVGIVRPFYNNSTQTPILTMQFNANGGEVSSDTFYLDSGNFVVKNDGSRDLTTWELGYGHPSGLYNATSFGLTRSGYSFAGWSKNADGTGAVYDEDLFYRAEEIEPALTGGSRTVVLYAIWAYNGFVSGKDGVYILQPVHAQNNCLSVAGNSLSSGANIQIDALQRTENQFFRFEHYGNADLYTITPVSSGLPITAENEGKVTYDNVMQATLSGDNTQKWRITQHTNWIIRPVTDTGLCLDVAGANTAAGTNVRLYPIHYHEAQEWIATPVLKHMPAVAATCTEPGNIEYWKVDSRYYYADSMAYQKISLADTVVPARGHSYGAWIVTREATPYEEGSRYHVCTRCGGKETQVIPVFRFDDVRDSSKYYFDAVYWAYAHKPYQITNGTGENLFSPDGTVTRGQIVTFLWRLAGQPTPSGYMPFTDVSRSKFYYDAVAWAAESGITTGKTGSLFDPNGTCTREQIVTFLWRFKGCPSAHASVNFTDVKQNAYYYNAVMWAYAKGITTGVSKTVFGVGKDCSRAMSVTFLYRSEQS